MNPRYILTLFIYVLLWVAITGYPLNQPRHKRLNTDDQPAEHLKGNEDGEIISVRITSSVHVARGSKQRELPRRRRKYSPRPRQTTERTTRHTFGASQALSASERHSVTALPPAALSGANIEYIKQLRTKKEGRPIEHVHPLHYALAKANNTNDDLAAQASDLHDDATVIEEDNGVPRARSIQSSHSLNNLHGPELKLNVTRDYRLNSTTTSVSFNIMHDVPNIPKVYSEQPNVYSEPSKVYSEPAKVYEKKEVFYSEPSKVYSEPAKIYGEQELVYSEPSKVYSEPAKVYGEQEVFYSEPAKVYGEPSKVYSEPSKVYGEPSKVYGEPSKVYSEPAKVYGEPSKFYSEPASLHLDKNINSPWGAATEKSLDRITTTIPSAVDAAMKGTEAPQVATGEKKNDEVDEAMIEQTNGRPDSGGNTSAETESSTDDKVGYVEEGEEFKKYRVEERTPDGFIVGEYGVVSNNDGSLRGVRYTADGDTNPRLIHDALVKFLHLTK